MASLSHRFSTVLWLTLLCGFLIREVEVSHTSLEVLLTRFSNPLNRNALNQCCDGRKDAKTCSDSCDIFFVVCLFPPHCLTRQASAVILRNASEFTTSQGNFSSSKGSTLGNFLSVGPFQMNLQTVNLFSISFYDDDSTLGSPTLGNRSSYEAIINFTQKLPTSINSLSIHSFNFSKNNISIEILYRLKCAKDYYGERCDVRCMTYDKHRHTRCLANGTQVCKLGWTGSYCHHPICPGKCNDHGSCVEPDVCKCSLGWRGSSCEECIPNPKCLHATCKKPGGACYCKKNWTGQYCNIYDNYCSHYKPCKNGGMCIHDLSTNFTCRCSPGWTGHKCDISSCPSSCNCSNADLSKPNVCSCKSGWTGPNCTQCVTSANCTHGYCTRPFECVCEEGWVGENCSEPVHKSKCSQRNPCQNGGTCEDVAMGNYRCNCTRSFTGRHCQENCTSGIKNNCSQRNNCTITEKLGSDETISDIDRLIYIVSSVLVLLIIACIVGLVCWHHRRRATFDVSSSEVVANSMVRSSLYTRGAGQGKNMLGFNNNVTVKPSEIVLNPMALQASHNSRSTLIDNGPDLFESRCGQDDNEDNSPDSTEYCII